MNDQYFKDIITTAVEGGINYWASTSLYLPDKASVRINEIGDEDYIISRNYLCWSDLKLVWDYIRCHPDLKFIQDWDDLDAEDCDAIVQVAIFDEVRYG